MKKVLLGVGVVALLAAAVGLSQSSRLSEFRLSSDRAALQIDAQEKNPWTNLKMNADADQFQFAIVSDRTGGHRANIFSKAVHQINLMQPTFVMSVGDLIEGYSVNEEVIGKQWDQFDGFVKQFEMPFFYTPGNHDMANKVLVQKWGERYGRRYFHFVYKNTLFVSLCSETPPESVGAIDPEQNEWLKKTLAENKDVRWTFVFLHKPIWTAKDLEKNGWAAVESALAGRKHHVFCGHVHRYQIFERNGTQYYQLATTGGGSRLRGVEYGEFDHFMWITMKKDKPVMAVVPLDGLLPADKNLPEVNEPGSVVKKVATFPVLGTVALDGQPLAKVTVTFHRLNEETKVYSRVCDGLTDDVGRVQMSTYSRFDGAPAGTFTVTVAKTGKGYNDGDVPENQQLPAKFVKPDTSPLKVTIKDGANDVKLELTSK